jgi:hypothetical protein
MLYPRANHKALLDVPVLSGIRAVVVAVVTLIPPFSSLAQGVYYVRAGATGANDGSDWNNAYTSLPATLQRGASYYVADGSYGNYTCDDSLSGTTRITIKKATQSNHGTDTGWNSAYGDGQATFGTITLNRGYYTISGSTRNENNWYQGGAYGFRMISLFASSLNADDATGSIVEYCDLGGSFSEGYYGGMSEAVYLVYNQHDITIRRCFLHNSTKALVQLAGGHHITIEHCWLGPGWGKVAIRGGNLGPGYNLIVRHNTFWNSTQIDPQDSTSGITAEIGIWDSPSVGMDNNEVYGNTFFNQHSAGRNAVIVVGGDNIGWRGVGGANTKVYNNTFAGIAEAPSTGNHILLNGNNTEAKNNLFYQVAGGMSIKASGTANNVNATQNPFMNYSGLDWRITQGSQAHNVGTTLGGPPYSLDRLGVTRGSDGTWDVGAFEYANANAMSPVIADEPARQTVSVDQAAAFALIATSSSRSSYPPIKWLRSGLD